MYRPGTAITSDRPLRPLGARHRSFPSASASFDLLYLAIVRTKAKIRICLKFALDLAVARPRRSRDSNRSISFNDLHRYRHTGSSSPVEVGAPS